MLRGKRYLLLFLLIVPGVFSQTKVLITGNVKDNAGKPLDNAIVRLESLGYVTVTDIQGNFTLDNTSPVLPRQSNRIHSVVPVVANGIAYFSVKSPVVPKFNVYSLQGRLCKSVELGMVTSGDYRLNLNGLLSNTLGNATYIIAGVIGDQKFSSKIVASTRTLVPLQLTRERGVRSLSKSAKVSSSVDRLIITKLGYATKYVELASYETTVPDVAVVTSFDIATPGVVTTIEDSLFNLLKDRIEKLDSVDGPDDLKAIDYISIRNGFEVILESDSTRFKSNVGLLVSSLLSLNTSTKIWNLIDSIEAYIEEVDDYFGEDDPQESIASNDGLLKQAMKDGGVLGLGKAMAATTPQIVTSVVQKPSFPRFLTLNYIQGTIESELLPVIDKVIHVANRVEGLENASMKMDVDGDTYELDKGEMYSFHAYALLLRAYMKMFCTYNMDVFTSAADQSYSWVDSMVMHGEEEHYDKVITLSGDTLYSIDTYDDARVIINMVKAYKYNIEERSDFMKIRNGYHASILEDLRSVPDKIKEGIASIKSESDDQEDDLIKISMLDSANGDMVDFTEEMVEEGFSAEFAQNFSSISNLMDFMKNILSGPYAFDETIDGKRIQLTINLSAFFTNPVTDLRQFLPKYSWVDENNWITNDVSKSEYVNQYWGRRPVYNQVTSKYSDTLYYINVYDDDETLLNVPESLIDSVVDNQWNKYYYVSQPIRYQVYVDSSFNLDPLRLTDDKGVVIPFDSIDVQIENKTFFPYFNDYTFNGIFPAMTRAKWIDLIYSE